MSSPAAPRNRWAGWGLVCGIVAVLLCGIPLVGLALGLVALAVAARGRAVARRALRGRGLAIAGLVLGLLSTAVSGVLTAGIARELFGSITATARSGVITVGGENSDFLFARSGDTWAASWVSKRAVGTGQLDIELHCRNELYLALFDAELKTIRQAPLRLVRQECSVDPRHGLFATGDGFGVVYARGERLELALFDRRKMKLAAPQTLTPAAAEALSSNGLFGRRLAVADHDSRVHLALLAIFAAALPGVSSIRELRVVAEDGGRRQTELLRVPRAGRDRPIYDGYFAGPQLLAWTQPTYGKVGYAFSTDGRRFERRESELRITTGTTNLDLRVLRAGQELAIFFHHDDEIWEQRFRLDGTPLLPPRRLVKAKCGLYNFNAAVKGPDCVVTYTEGNDALMVYSCATRQSRSLGQHWNTAMECAGGACIRSSKGATIELLAP